MILFLSFLCRERGSEGMHCQAMTGPQALRTRRTTPHDASPTPRNRYARFKNRLSLPAGTQQACPPASRATPGRCGLTTTLSDPHTDQDTTHTTRESQAMLAQRVFGIHNHNSDMVQTPKALVV